MPKVLKQLISSMMSDVEKLDLIWTHGDSQVQQPAGLDKAGNPPYVPDITPGIHWVPVPAQPVVLVAREGDRKVELRQIAVEPGLCQSLGSERSHGMVLGVDFLVLHGQQSLDACNRDFGQLCGGLLTASMGFNKDTSCWEIVRVAQGGALSK